MFIKKNHKENFLKSFITITCQSVPFFNASRRITSRHGKPISTSPNPLCRNNTPRSTGLTSDKTATRVSSFYAQNGAYLKSGHAATTLSPASPANHQIHVRLPYPLSFNEIALTPYAMGGRAPQGRATPKQPERAARSAPPAGRPRRLAGTPGSHARSWA